MAEESEESVMRKFVKAYDELQNISPIVAGLGGLFFLIGTFFEVSSKIKNYGVITAVITIGFNMLLWLANYLESVFIKEPAARVANELRNTNKQQVIERLYAQYFHYTATNGFLQSYGIGVNIDLEANPLLKDQEDELLMLYQAIKKSPYQQARHVVTTAGGAILNSGSFAIIFLLLAAYNVTRFVTEELLTGTNAFSLCFTLFLFFNACYHGYRTQQHREHSLAKPDLLELEATLKLAHDNYLDHTEHSIQF